MSGAALFSGALIVGVVVVEPAHFGTDRLKAVPTTAIVAEAGFREALIGDSHRTLELRAVEDLDITRGVLRDPYRPLPARATPARLRHGADSLLLRPEYGVVPFEGRPHELEKLGVWCAGDPGLELTLVLGAGGTGKTRLAAELCRRLQTEGALAGFFERNMRPERLEALAEATAPLLVVVDEAHGRIDELAQLIIRLARTPSETPLRVLMLARQAGDWWDRLLPDRLADDPDAEFAHSTAAVRELGPVADSVGQRESAFGAAAVAFARRIDGSVAGAPAPDLGQPLFEQLLFIHLDG